jgi:topoisomerase-4 subunit A
LRALDKLKKLTFDIDFSQLAVKGRDSVGNIVSKYAIKKVELKEKGISTLGARELWFDESIKRLNDEGRGRSLGNFIANDKILVLLSSGDYQILVPEISTHFEDNTIHVEKLIPNKPISCAYYDGERDTWMAKRFIPEYSKGLVRFISESPKSKLGLATTLLNPTIYIRFNKKFRSTANKLDETVNLREFIAVKGVKAMGNKITSLPILNIELLECDPELEAQLLSNIVGEVHNSIPHQTSNTEQTLFD